MDEKLKQASENLATLLARLKSVRIVFAESCTAGMASVAVAQTPGISAYLCGSAVTYREATKNQWLGVNADDLARHSAVSAVVTRQMAQGVLEQTREAGWSAAITGHVGPGAPADLDGIIFIAIARRGSRNENDIKVVLEKSAKLTARSRSERICEAATALLSKLADSLRDAS